MKSIIIIDDDTEISDQVAETIRQYFSHETKVIQVYNVAEAINHIGEFTPYIALIDIRLQHESGFEVAEYIKKNNISTRVVLMSGESGVPEKQKAYLLGAIDYLEKPFTVFELIAKLKLYLGISLQKN
jgi:DNA-binding response OmpR family regulator